MPFVTTLLLALSVSVDAFAVSAGGALTDRGGRLWRHALLAGAFFGGFQFFMPLIGGGAADFCSEYIRQWDHFAAFGLLAAVGGNMIHEGIKTRVRGEDKPRENFFTLKNLLIMAVATSIDALAVGASLALTGVSLLIPALAMGAVTAAVSVCGVVLGRNARRHAGEWLLLCIGGAVIIGVGLNILIAHLRG